MDFFVPPLGQSSLFVRSSFQTSGWAGDPRRYYKEGRQFDRNNRAGAILTQRHSGGIRGGTWTGTQASTAPSNCMNSILFFTSPHHLEALHCSTLPHPPWTRLAGIAGLARHFSRLSCPPVYCIGWSRDTPSPSFYPWSPASEGFFA